MEWHDGFAITSEDLREHPDFRESRIVEVAKTVGVDGRLDARSIGLAARCGEHDPQDLKKVWHYVARYGACR